MEEIIQTLSPCAERCDLTFQYESLYFLSSAYTKNFSSRSSEISLVEKWDLTWVGWNVLIKTLEGGMNVGRWDEIAHYVQAPDIILLSEKIKQKLKYDTISWKVGWNFTCWLWKISSHFSADGLAVGWFCPGKQGLSCGVKLEQDQYAYNSLMAVNLFDFSSYCVSSLIEINFSRTCSWWL